MLIGLSLGYIMGQRTFSPLLRLLGWTAVVVMTCAALAMIGTALM
jgi:hypothetical protein